MGSVPRGECHRAAGGTARREHTECHARTQSGRGGLRAIAPFYFLGVYFITVVRLDVLDLGSTNA